LAVEEDYLSLAIAWSGLFFGEHFLPSSWKLSVEPGVMVVIDYRV